MSATEERSAVLPQPAPHIAAVPSTTPFVAPEALARAAGHARLLRLGANESAFGASPRAVAAMSAELERSSWYGDPESLELRMALAERHRCGIENLTVGSGIDDLLAVIVRAYLPPGGVAVATRGSYPTFTYQVVGYGGRLEAVPALDDGTIDIEAFAQAAHATNAAVAYVANPDNPSGSFIDARAAARLRELLPPATLLILDEAYADFIPVDRLPPDEIDPRTIRLRTFSKAFGLAGMRIGYAISPPAMHAIFEKIRLHFGVNRLAQIAALASLGDRSHVANVVAEVVRGRADYCRLAEQHGLRTVHSETNFVCIEIGSRARAEAVLRELLALGVFVRKPGAPPLDGCIRVTVGTPDERLRFEPLFAEALARAEAKISR